MALSLGVYLSTQVAGGILHDLYHTFLSSTVVHADNGLGKITNSHHSKIAQSSNDNSSCAFEKFLQSTTGSPLLIANENIFHKYTSFQRASFLALQEIFPLSKISLSSPRAPPFAA